MPAGDLIGQVLEDRYRILRLIGRGGMGAVYEAEAVRLGRRCAVKVLLPEFTGSDAAVQRFRREAQVAAKIKHPNVVEIFDTGTTPDGVGYIAMELLIGESLDRTLQREGRLPWSRARKLTVQICRALAAAHAEHVVHRDMKPENCHRVVRDGDDDFIKVLDFGIAKLTDPTPTAGTPRLTATNAVIGTYAYMAYEQIAGQDCDHRVDVWAAGVMLYEMLTGALPFVGDNPGQIWAAIFQTTPAPLATHVPGIPAAVEDIVRRALARDRDQRYPDADALARALLAVPADDADTSADASLRERMAAPTVDLASASHSGPTAFAATVAAAPRVNHPTDRVDPEARTALGERADTAESLRTAHTTAVPLPPPPPAPRKRISRRALLFFGSLGAPALIAAVTLSGRDRERPSSHDAVTSDPPPPPVTDVTQAPPRPVAAPPPDESAPPDTKAEEPPAKKSAPREPYAKRVAAEIKRAQHKVKNECMGLVGKVRVDLVISAATGRATKIDIGTLASTTMLARCVQRILKPWRFPKGEPGDADYAQSVDFESR